MSTQINYDHSLNLHTLTGPAVVVPLLFGENKQISLLDVGCGTGTWLKAALEYGISDVLGIDGVTVPIDRLHILPRQFIHSDLTKPIHIGRHFDVALCLEVAEHLDASSAPVLIKSLVKHATVVVFSAACPGQIGQHHVNCQWPQYWQGLFNENEFACSDDVRWKIWDNSNIESWYRQNLFIAKYDPMVAGKEPRLRSVVHPDMFTETLAHIRHTSSVEEPQLIEKGRMPIGWYLQIPFLGLANKARRIVRRWRT